MSNTKHSLLKTSFAIIASGLVIAASVWLFFNRQYVLDAYTNFSYTPNAQIQAISERTKLTEDGRFTFYATRPEVLDQQSFNQSCPRQEAGSPILGCYTPEDRIYMYNVTSAELDGMKEVTAVHELLHAVWSRTSEAERQELAVLLRQAYEKNADDALRTRMDYYNRTEPGQFDNELYAIIGTEMADLSPSLEQHYAQYFDRQVVLNLHDNYSATYLQLSNRSTELFDAMNQLSSSIDAASGRYNAAAEAFSRDVDSFNSRAANGSFSSNAQFNTERAALIARSNQLDADRQALNMSIELYNRYYAEYEEIGKKLETLNNSMDSYHTIEETPSI